METKHIIPFEWSEKEVKKNGKSRLNIHIWCHDNNSENYLLVVEDFYVECYLQLPMFVNDRFQHWDRSKGESLMNELQDATKIKFDFQFEKKFTFYYYQEEPSPMMRLRFACDTDMKRFTKMVRDGIPNFNQYFFKIHETGISNVRKLITERNLKYSDWITFLGVRVNEMSRISRLKNEFKVSYKNLFPCTLDTSRWEVHPSVLSFDIETYSHNHNRMPDNLDIRDKMYMLTAVYQRMRDPSTRRKFCIVLGDTDDIADTTMIRVNSEEQIIQEFAKIVLDTDPDILTGWNIVYDYTYMEVRRCRYEMKWPNMGRLWDSESKFVPKGFSSKAYNSIKNDYVHMDGRISMDLLPVIKREYPGRQQYTLKVISDEFLQGRSKLDVSPKEMFKIYEMFQEAKHNLESYYRSRQAGNYVDPSYLPVLEAKYREAVLEMTRISDYGVRDSDLPVEILDKTGVYYYFIRLSNVVGVTIHTLYAGGQQQRCLSCIYDYAHKRNMVIDQVYMPASSYSGGFVTDPIVGFWTNVVTLDFASLYPNIIIAYNICHSTYLKNNDPKNLKPEDIEPFEFTEEIEDEEEDDNATGRKKKKKVTRYEEVKAYFVKDHVRVGVIPQICSDLIAARNQMKLELKYRLADKDILLNYLQLLKYIETNNWDGILPETSYPPLEHVKEQLSSGIYNVNELRDYLMKELAILNNIITGLKEGEKAVKVSTNSYYGFLGVQEGAVLPLIIAAKVVTYMGRTLINNTSDVVCKKYNCRRIYGDTDSAMLKPNFTEDRKEVYILGKKITQFINGVKAGEYSWELDRITEVDIPGLYKSNLRVEFENIKDGLFIKKKKYAALIVNFDEVASAIKENRPVNQDKIYQKSVSIDDEGNKTEKYYIMKKGITIARRDNCKFSRDVYTACLHKILLRRPFLEVLTDMYNSIDKLMRGEVDYRDLAIIVGVNEEYKQKSNMMNIFKEYLNSVGIPVQGGERLEFLVVNETSREGVEDVNIDDKVGYKMRLLKQFEDNPGKWTIDYNYYLEHKVKNALEQLIAIAYPTEMKMSREFLWFYVTKRSKERYLDESIMFYITMRKSGMTHDEIIKFFDKNINKLYEVQRIILNRTAKPVDWDDPKEIKFFEDYVYWHYNMERDTKRK